MSIPDALRARDPRAAARSCVLILAVSAAVLCGFNLVGLGHGTVPAQVASWALVAVLLGAGAICARVRPEVLDRAGVLTTIAVGGVAALCGLNVLTEDPSAAAQAFLAFPVLWVAAHFHRAAVVLVTATAIAGDALTLLLLVPAGAALTDAAFFGAVLAVIAVMQTRSNLRQDDLVAALHEQARIDALTGLVNRRSFDETMARVLDRSPARGTAVVLIDIDRFKAINDTHGHPAGDAALVHVARVLRERVRAGDAVLARLGGDELAVLLPDCSAGTAVDRAHELLAAVAGRPLCLAGGGSVSLSLSIGVAHSSSASSPEDLYSAADAALYRAKRDGRGRVAASIPRPRQSSEGVPETRESVR